MADGSKIEWTDATWNPVTGCTKVSPGCDHCYAERIVERFHGKGAFAEVRLNDERLDAPLRWRKPRRVFVNSMSDLFHDAVPDEYVAQVFAVMGLARRHTFQVLTKRHGRARALLGRRDFREAVAEHGSDLIGSRPWRRGQIEVAEWTPTPTGTGDTLWSPSWPLPNVWLGVSVEDQKWADIRIPALLDTPAAVRFLSCEPLIGPVNLVDHWIGADPYRRDEPSVDWVIVGGESGPGARPMHPDWARSLRDQCQAAGVPFFFKQWGEWAPNGWRGIGNFDQKRERLVGEPLDEAGHREVIERVGKKAAGRELDGRTHDEYPEVGR